MKSLLRRLRRRARDWYRGETDETYFDLYDLRDVNAILTGNGIAPVAYEPRQADESVGGAFRQIIAFCQRVRPPSFRDCLADVVLYGPSSDLAHPLSQNPEFSAAARTNVRAALATGMGEKGKRIYEIREDLREAFPFGQTPHPDRAKLLIWMVTHGVRDLGLTPEEVLWFLYERDAEPDRGLVATYLVRPDWQEAVPHALTPSGWPEFKQFLRTKYGLRGRWFDRAALNSPLSKDEQRLLAPSDGPPPPAVRGVNVLAHFRYASGLQEAALAVANGLEASGYRVSKRDLPVRFPCDWRDRERYQGLELFDTTLYVAAVNTFPKVWYPRCGLRMRPGVRRIAVWYWELEDVPAEWVTDMQWADEVWAPTQFIASAFRKCLAVPVLPMLPGVSLPAVTPRHRSYFALPDDRFLFLFTFDMGSVMARKNPLGLIEAYRRAFRNDDRVHLAVKVSRGENDPVSLAALQRAADEAGLTVIDRVMTREDVLSLFQSADCFASLHRSEGLGLGMAESMLMGKPVIATGYSGNLDFMTPDVSHLVNYERVELPAGLDPYPAGSHWAEPSVEHAAELMRRVFEQPEESRALGDRAREHVAKVLDPAAAAKRVADRLAAIGAARKSR